MKTLLHLVLLFGAVIGLMGGSTAMAMAPATGSSVSAMVDMDCCADMASGSMHDGGAMPCKKITWQCIAAMGCAPAAIALPAFTTEVAPRAVRLPHARLAVAAMLGRTVAPELDPPAFPI